jgi:hypothetical protein
MPRGVFLDRNVISRSVISECVVRKKRIQWGPDEHLLDLSGWQEKPPREGDNAWISNEVSCLPTVARLAVDGEIKLYESRECRYESGQAVPGGAGTTGDIFAKCRIIFAADAVDRSFSGPKTPSQLSSRCNVIEFCELLRNTNPAMLMKVPEFWDKFPKIMKRNLEDIDRFHKILDALPTKTHWPDALHLWTAETHGAEFFLTLDRKFINALTKTARIDLPTNPVLPSQLLVELGIEDRDPMPDIEFDFASGLEF